MESFKELLQAELKRNIEIELKTLAQTNQIIAQKNKVSVVSLQQLIVNMNNLNPILDGSVAAQMESDVVRLEERLAVMEQLVAELEMYRNEVSSFII